MTSEFAGKRVVVVGLGVSGFAAARALHDLDAKVRVTDDATTEAIVGRADALRREGIEVTIGGGGPGDLDADLAVISPGVPPYAPVVTALRASGIETIGEIEVAWRLARCPLLAVTGTNGKTTTTSLLAAMLTEDGRSAAAAGNIGTPLVEAVFSIPEDGAIAVEVSSFQLATIERFHPQVAILLNIAEDHTDWHGSFEDYVAAKARIYSNQTADDILVVNVDDPTVMRVAAAAPSRVVGFSARRSWDDGIGVAGGFLRWRGRDIISVDDVPLPGGAGLEDVAAAAVAALEFGVDASAVARAVMGFRPLSHRLEVVAELEGVSFIDDSKATNPHATLSAVRGLRDVVLIAGGRSKGIALQPLSSTVPPVIAVVAMGESASLVEEVFDGLVPVDRASTMDEAVAAAWARSVAGGSVLLSPGCASLDMYSSYAERGERFARAVRTLVDQEGRTNDGG